jgi:hypothetical protein
LKTVKMSLANIQGKLNRVEMREIMAGDGACTGSCDDKCTHATGCRCTGKEGDSFRACYLPKKSMAEDEVDDLLV